MHLQRHWCAFQGTTTVHPMSNGAWRDGSPVSWTIIHTFFLFRANFRLHQAGLTNFFAPDLLWVPGVLTDGYGCLIPSFFTHFCLILARLTTRSLNSVGSPDGVQCVLQGTNTVQHMSTGSCPQREPGVVDYNPLFFHFLSQFSTSSSLTTLFVLEHPRGYGVLIDSYM